MDLTRANVEAELVGRVGADLLARLGMTALSDGTNADLNSPIAASLRTLNVVLTAPPLVTDADFEPLANTAADQLLDVAELRLLMTLQNRAAVLVDQQIGTQSRISLGQIAKDLELAVTRLERRVDRLYGVGRGVLTTGMMTLPIAARACTEEF